MKQIIVTLFCCLMITVGLSAQNIVKGVVKYNNSEKPLQGVSILIESKNISQLTNTDGSFILNNLPNGDHLITIKKEGYETQNYPVSLSGSPIDLGVIFMYDDTLSEDQDLSVITITDDELNDDASAADNISGLLQASRDTYLRTAAFDFGGSFYRVRGLDSENGTVMVNGIEMNKLFNGRPQWSNWGGLNDVTRNQEFSNFLTPSNYGFGGLLGTTYINTRPSEQRPGVRVSYASSNRSYVHRAMGTYATGMMQDGWSFLVSGSKRAGSEGFVDGTSYNAFSLFASLEKRINDNHALSFTSIYAPNRRGKSSSNTQEVFDLKGIQYNSFWGYQNGEIRNSRIKELIEPIFILNHYWDINENTSLQTNIGYQYGQLGNSRLEFNGTNLNPNSGFPEGGGANPDPTYYQKLPSYALRNFPDNPGIAFGLQQQFLNDGQLNWDKLYQTNIDSKNRGENAINILYEDRVDDQLFNASTIFNSELNDNINLTASVTYKNLRSENFASVLDLLGGTGYLDVDGFASKLNTNPLSVQNDVLNPNRIVTEGDRFRYNYNILSNVVSGFAQAQFKYNKIDFYAAVTATKTDYQREGLYQNGGFLSNSLGKGDKINFNGFGGKAGFTYKLTGRHLFDFNGAYLTKAPTIRNTFANSRENHAVIQGTTEEKIISFDGSYILRTPTVQAKLTGYYTKMEDANEVSFYFADGVSVTGADNTNFFIQEILQGVDKKHFGGEFAIEVKATPTIKVKAVAVIGQYTYDNNPNIAIASENFVGLSDADEFGRLPYVKSYLKNYKVASGPQRAFSLGFEYRDPDYWWISATTNFLSHAYIDVSPIQRSSNFYTDFDGQPFNDYDPTVARELLQQERFKGYMVANLVGGKSWKIDNKYISVFASINNLFDKTYKTGGFEQGRNANYRQLQNDQSLDTPVFGPRYWYGRGTTYFLNVNVRF